jgi:hypothetical protein
MEVLPLNLRLYLFHHYVDNKLGGGEVVFLYRIVRRNKHLLRYYQDRFRSQIPFILAIDHPFAEPKMKRFQVLLPHIYECLPMSIQELISLDTEEEDLRAACCGGAKYGNIKLLSTLYVRSCLIPMIKVFKTLKE